MKHLVLICLIASAAFAQEKAWKKDIHPDPLIRPHVFLPVAIGDNLLSEAHKETVGVGLDMSFVSIYNFHLGVRYHFTAYEVTDVSLAGNFKNSRYWGLGPFVSYEVPLATRMSLWPEIGVGYAALKQQFTGERIADQEGIEFRAGVFADYKFNRYVSIFTGVSYLNSKMRISANPEIRDFYERLQQLQISFGLQFEGRPNRPKSAFEKTEKTD